MLDQYNSTTQVEEHKLNDLCIKFKTIHCQSFYVNRKINKGTRFKKNYAKSSLQKNLS